MGDCDICHCKLKDPQMSICGHCFCRSHFESSNAGGITGRVCPIDCKSLQEKKRVCACGREMSCIEAMNNPTGCAHGQAMEDQLSFPTEDTQDPIVQGAASSSLLPADAAFARAEVVVRAMEGLEQQVTSMKEGLAELQAKLKEEEGRRKKLEEDLAKEKASAAKLGEDLAKEKASAAKLDKNLAKEKASAAKLGEDLEKEKASAAKLDKYLAKEKASSAKLGEDLAKEKASAAKLGEDLAKEKASAAKYVDFFRKTHIACLNVSRSLRGSARIEQEVQDDGRHLEGASAAPAEIDMPTDSGLAVSGGFEKEVFEE